MAFHRLGGIGASMVCLFVASQRVSGAESSPAAQAKIESVVSAYRALKSYQCSHERSWVISTRGGQKSEQSGTAEVYFQAPDRFALISSDLEIKSDATTLVVRRPLWNQYVSTSRGDIATLDERLRELTAGREGLPLVVEAALRREASLAEIWPGVKSFTGIGEGVSGGRDCWWVTAEIEDVAYRSEQRVDQRIGIDQENGLIVRTVADFSTAARATMPQVESAVYTTTNKNIRVNEPIEPGVFVFVPTADDRPVSAFEAPPEPEPTPVAEQAEQAPGGAPVFAEKDLEGKEVTLASFKGRVLVLDFWATWCGPCISAMPAIQHLADSFKGKPVDVVGVNVDRPGMEAQIRRVLEQKKNTMRQIIDSDSSMGNAYSAEAIPLVVIIDQKGVIRHRHVGYAPRGDEKMAREIEALLKEQAAP